MIPELGNYHNRNNKLFTIDQIVNYTLNIRNE